jgi:heptosyltransferase-2
MSIKVKQPVCLRPGEPILVLALQGIGNTLFLLPLIEELHRRFPGHPVDAVVRSEACRLILSDASIIRRHFVLPGLTAAGIPRIAALFSQVRKNRYGVSMLTFPANHPVFNLMSWLTGARIRISFRYRKGHHRRLGWLNNRLVPVLDAHDYAQNLGMLAGLGEVAPTDFRPVLWSGMRSGNPPSSLKVIGIHPGSSRDRAMIEKRWPAERFLELIGRLSDRLPRTEFRVFFGPDEADLKERFHQAESDRVRLVFGLGLKQTVAEMSACGVFIANDSGLMNLATALGARVLNIAGGPTDPVRTWPAGEGNAILFSTIHCYPCRGLRNIGDRFSCIYPTRKCLEEIPVDRVEMAVYTLLGLS